MLRLIVGVLLATLLWNPVVTTTFIIGQGQDPPDAYDMGNNYEIWWLGFVHHWVSQWDFDVVTVIDDIVEEFTLADDWLIGRTEKSWFAINKKTHEVHNPISSLSKVEAITDLDISSVKLLTLADIPPSYPAVYPWTKKAVANVKKILIVLPLLLGFGPNIWQLYRFSLKRLTNRLCKKRNYKKNGSEQGQTGC